MKIAMVSEHASPLAALGGVDAGGQNVHVAALSAALAANGHDVTVYTRRDSADLPDWVEFGPGVVVGHVPAGPAQHVGKDELLPYMAGFGDYLAARWREEPPDIVHGHFWMSGLAALHAVRELDVPVVQTFHALGTVKRRYQGPADTSPPQRLRLEQAVARSATRIIATCNDEVDELNRMGVSPRKVTVVPCGVDTALFTSSGEQLPRTERPRLLSIGRLVERKGIDDAIRALRKIPSAELLIAGGPDRAALGEDPEARRLLEVARQAGVSRRVKLLGRVPHEQVPALIRSADVVVCTPWYEPFGIVPLEAMACGVPVVATAVGGLLDSVEPGCNGLHVPPHSPDHIAHAVRELLTDPVRRYAYGIAGADRARVRFSWDRVARETARVYRRLVPVKEASATHAGSGPAAASTEGVA